MMDEKQEAELFGGATQVGPEDETALVEPTQAAAPQGIEADDLFGDDVITQEQNPTSLLESTQPQAGTGTGTVESTTPAVEGAVKQEPDHFGAPTQPHDFSELNGDEPVEKLESDLFWDDEHDAALNEDNNNNSNNNNNNNTRDLAPTQAMDSASQDPAAGDLMDDLFGPGVDSPNLGEENNPPVQPSSSSTQALETQGEVKADDEEEDLFGDTFMGAEDDLFGEGGVTMDEGNQLMDRPDEDRSESMYKPRTYGGERVGNENAAYNNQQKQPSADDFEESEGGEPQEPQPQIADLFGSDDEAMEAKEKEGEKLKENARKTLGGRVKEEPAKVKEEPVEVDANHEAKKERADGAHAHAKGSADSEPELEDEERDLFGELSEDESGVKGEVETHCVRKRLLPDGEVCLFKIPNTLAMETVQFNPESLDKDRAGFRERMNENDRPMIELCGPENTIRWRLKRNEQTGEVIYDDQGDAEFESNSKFVEFEDGSIFLQVGEELFQCQSTAEPRSQLYVEENNDLFVFHKPLTKQMHVIPSGIGTQTHKMLLSSQINKVRTHRAVKPISIQQATKQTMEQEAEAIEAARREKEKLSGFGGAARGLGGKKRQEMDASYLESDELAEGPSLKALKKNSNMSNAFLYRAAQTLR